MPCTLEGKGGLWLLKLFLIPGMRQGLPRPAVADEIGAHGAIWQKSEQEMQMAEMLPYTLLFRRHHIKSVFHLANAPPEPG